MRTKRSDFFALIIGINEYKEHHDDLPDLFGFVADAESFKQYFQDDLGVPESNITSLYNTEATRSKTLQGFEDLATDPRIPHGSAICIFFAGHGAVIESPPEWEAGGREGQIQAIVPHNYSENPNSPILSIMDRELSKLLNAICSIGLRSHVLLAACESTKKAYEIKDGRGQFSTALLSLFKKTEIDKLRYSDILKNLDKLPRQNPQCEGNHQDRYIFSNTSPGKNKAFALHVAEDDVVTLNGGIANGITRGAEFDVFSHGSGSDIILGQFVVNTPNLYNSIGTMNPDAETLTAGQQYFAEQKRSGERIALRIYSDSSLGEQLYMQLQTTKPQFSNFDIVQLKNEAHIAIEKEDDDRARLRVIDPSLDPTRKTIKGYSCSMKDLGAVLEGISFYHWTRDDDCKNVALRQSVINDIEVEFYKLKYNGRNAHTLFSADSPNLCEIHNGQKQVNLTIADNSEVYYGIKLINNSCYDLFPAIFYLDSDDLSICSYYHHHQTGPVQMPEAPLPSKGNSRPGSLTIGYGSGGAHPFSFSVPDGQVFDVGLVKIFLFTRPVDVSDFQQRSPFEMNARVEGKRKLSDKQGLVSGVIDIPVMQCRENLYYESKNQMST